MVTVNAGNSTEDDRVERGAESGEESIKGGTERKRRWPKAWNESLMDCQTNVYVGVLWVKW
jgi:hypothetical protein|tara:strand:- start:32098 stop:32280 length:183 start_codon:yes stop_codon:yes gene_type:complete